MYQQYNFSSSDDELDEFEDDYDFQEFLREQKRKNRANISSSLTEEQVKEQRIKKFYISLINGKLDEVITELKQGLDVNQNIQNDWAPILIAASTGNYDLVKELHKFGADVTATRDGQTTLMYACDCPDTTVSFNESSKVVKFLLDLGVNPNALDRRRRNSLMFAANRGNFEAVKLLVPHTNLEYKDNQEWNALFWAVNGGKIEIVEYLLDKGLHFDKPDVRGNTLLDIARENDFEDIVKLFASQDDDDQDILSNLQTDFNDIFNDLKINEKPQFLFEVSKILHGTRCENLIKLFVQKEVSLFDLLSANEENLKEIGVPMPFHRKRILAGIHRFHKHPFHPKSLPVVGKHDIYSNVNVAAAVLSAVKQSICMEASLKYIKNNISDSSIVQKDEIKKILDDISRKLKKFKRISMELNGKVKYWDLEIEDPIVIQSNSGRRWFPWRKTALTLGIIILSMNIFSKHFKFKFV